MLISVRDDFGTLFLLQRGEENERETRDQDSNTELYQAEKISIILDVWQCLVLPRRNTDSPSKPQGYNQVKWYTASLQAQAYHMTQVQVVPTGYSVSPLTPDRE